jgi:DNA-binding XRE family transcriptional regulator
MIEPHRREILELLRQPGMNKTLLADQAGVHRNTLNSIESAAWNPTSDTLGKIMDAAKRLRKKNDRPVQL